MDEPPRRVNIAVAGNTGLPCLLALRAKGFHVHLEYHRLDGPEVTKPDYRLAYRAVRDGCHFHASSPEELLGLVAMWEVRGDDWRPTPAEFAFDDELHDSARTFDPDGNELFDE